MTDVTLQRVRPRTFGELTPHRAALALGALTALAFTLRLLGLDQSLVDDEIFTYDIVTSNGPAGIVDEVQRTSITPPLHYLLAAAAERLGSAAEWVRVPSLLLGTATVPMVYLLGARTVGRGAALLGAALIALSPMAVWYGVEARAYATLTFLVTLSSYALIRALRSQPTPWRWWALFVAASVAVLYTHYTGIFVLVVQAGWAVWVGRSRLVEVAVAQALVALAYLPWLPSYQGQDDNEIGILAIGFLHPLSVTTAWENVAKLFVGQPFPPWDDLLGPFGLALLGVAGVALAAGAILKARAGGVRLRSPSAGVVLVILLAAATPAGVLLYSIAESSLYAPRNLLASLPALCLLVGAAVTRVAPPLRTVAAVCLLAAVGIATVSGLDTDHRRPPYDEVAEYLDREAGPDDAILLLLAGGDPFGRNPAMRSLQLGFNREHPFLTSAVAADRPRFRRVLDRAAERRRLFVVVGGIPGFPLSILRERLDGRFTLLSEQLHRAYAPIRVAVYRTPSG